VLCGDLNLLESLNELFPSTMWKTGKCIWSLTNNEKVSALIQKMVKVRDARIKFAKDAIKDYNEFDFN